MSRKPILCMDFDGVIHSYTSGWKGADAIPDAPVEGAIGFLLEALQCFDVHVFSSRSGQPGGIKAMREYIRKNAGACWHESPAGVGLEDIKFPKEKPPAFLSIDDRALMFSGVWPDVRSLLGFRPWNKQEAQHDSCAVCVEPAMLAAESCNPGSFGAAIECLKAGKKVARVGWNGKGMWLCYIHPGNAMHHGFDMQPCIGMKTADNKMQPGWLASQTDMLAEDWIVVE